MKIVRFADLAATPWKNGGGTTTEIAVSPPGATFEDFDWRLSIADVASDGPFSKFPRIDRTLTVIEGNGLTITVGGKPATLTTASPPLSFPGDIPVYASLTAGPIRDFNVMTRRGRYDHRVTRHEPGTDSLIVPDSDIVLALSLGQGSIAIGGKAEDVAFGDIIDLSPHAGSTLSETRAVLLIELWKLI